MVRSWRADIAEAFGEPAPATAAVRTDSWRNALSGIGTESYDPRTAGQFRSRGQVSDEEAAQLWQADPIMGRVVEIWPREMLRAGFRFKPGRDFDEAGGDELADDLRDEWRKHRLIENLWTAIAFKRAFGGAGVNLLTADNAADMSKPLNVRTVREFAGVNVYEPGELQPASYLADPSRPSFGEPASWWLTPHASGYTTLTGRMLVHGSRLAMLRGIRTGRRHVAGTHEGHGGSYITRCYNVVRDYTASWAAASLLLQSFSIAQLKIDGLNEILGSDRAAELIRGRAEALNLSMSIARMAILDAQESYTRDSVSLSGLPETLREMAQVVAAAADTPLTLLMGVSPGGMNATGESDIRFFYDRIAAAQTHELEPIIRRVVEVQLAARGVKTDSWSIEFGSLWQPSENEQANTRKVIAEADEKYYAMGALSADEIAEARFGGEWSMDTTVDIDARNRMLADEPPPEPEPADPDDGEV